MVKIEKAKLEDAEIITEIKTLAYNDETRRFGPGRDGGPKGYDSLEETKILMSKFYYYKILCDNEIVGCFWLNNIGEKQFELEDFCIYPKHHNKGYGKSAMKLMEEMFSEVDKWVLGTPYYSIRNQHIYEKMGYVKVGEAEDGFLFLYEKRK